MTTLRFVQLPIPFLIGSLSFKLRLRGWRPGHHQLAHTGSNQSLSSSNNHGHHPAPNESGNTAAAAGGEKQQSHYFSTGNEYGAVGKVPPPSASGGLNCSSLKIAGLRNGLFMFQSALSIVSMQQLKGRLVF